MNKIKSEYQVLKFLSKQSDWLFTEDIANGMHTDERFVSPTLLSIKSQNLVAMKYQHKTNTLKSPTYKITVPGIERFRKTRRERFDQALTLLGVVATIIGTLVAVIA